jgi:ribonuclease HI
MTASKPATLTELLKTLERSGELRSLARECGLSVRELRRRLAIWRRELNAEDGGPVAGTGTGVGKKDARKDKKKSAGPGDWPDLPAAATLETSPLPGKGRSVLEIFTDGASRGNPGPAAIGMVFRQKGGPGLAQHRETIGQATNNVAEYRAVVAALEHCRRWDVQRVHLFIDSELIVRQLHGTYRVKSPDLRPLYQQVIFLSKDLADFKVRHVPRSENGFADHLANLALDS